tara:strand:+ start:30079 stop:30312 length:234 start_codon:yes stop_codon:yes gene_type:complete
LPFEFIFKKLEVIDPPIKLIPTIKLIGKFIVSSNIKLTLLLVELFCIPIIKIENRDKLNMIGNKVFITINIFNLNLF